MDILNHVSSVQRKKSIFIDWCLSHPYSTQNTANIACLFFLCRHSKLSCRHHSYTYYTHAHSLTPPPTPTHDFTNASLLCSHNHQMVPSHINCISITINITQYPNSPCCLTNVQAERVAGLPRLLTSLP